MRIKNNRAVLTLAASGLFCAVAFADVFYFTSDVLKISSRANANIAEELDNITLRILDWFTDSVNSRLWTQTFND